jgi:hypothetical protein
VSCRVYITQVRRPVLRIVHTRAAKLSLFIILLWSHSVLFNNILKKHNEIREKARQIQAGMCTEPKLTSNWHSRANTLSLSPTAVASLRVRNPRHRSSSDTFLLGKFVREPNCSWTGAFVNRRSTVLYTVPLQHLTDHKHKLNTNTKYYYYRHKLVEPLQTSLDQQNLTSSNTCALEDSSLVVYDTISLGVWFPMFQQITGPPSSRIKQAQGD